MCFICSISGAPEEEVSEDSEKSLDTSDPEITSKGEDSDAALAEVTSRLEISIDEEVGENWPNSAEKGDLRRTLEELFLDSPTAQSAVENAFNFQVVNSVQFFSYYFCRDIDFFIRNTTLSSLLDQWKRLVVSIPR